MFCHRCGLRFESLPEETWDNACPRCGCLAWLHRGMVVPVRIESIRPYDGPIWSYAARVTLGDNVRGIAGLITSAEPGDEMRCEVTQVDHAGRRVDLKEVGT